MHLPRNCWRSLWLAVALAAPSLHAEDSITLTTGEITRGRILSETDQQVEIEVANADRTIVSKRVVPRAEVNSVQRETPEQAAERKSFESLSRYKLDPNSAYPTNYYPAVITAFDKFLAAYPHSDHTAQINALRADWKAEYPQALLAVKSGLVKFRGQWLTAQQAQVLAEEERNKKEASRKQQEEANRRQAEETSRQQQQAQSQPEKKSSSAAHAATRAGYQVDINSAAPY